MGATHQPEDQGSQIIAIRRELKALRDRVGLVAAKFRGEFEVLHATAGTWLLKIGRGSQGKYFLSIRRDDGSVAFEIGTTTSGQQFWAGWDRSAHIVVSDDALSGEGLARPWLPHPSVDTLASAMPMVSNTSWFQTAGSGSFIKQQPFMQIQALVRTAGGSAGQARFAVNGTPVGSVIDIGVDQFFWTPSQKIALPGNYDDSLFVTVEVQRTSGTGTVGGRFVWTQRQT